MNKKGGNSCAYKFHNVFTSIKTCQVLNFRKFLEAFPVLSFHTQISISDNFNPDIDQQSTKL